MSHMGLAAGYSLTQTAEQRYGIRRTGRLSIRRRAAAPEPAATGE